MTRRYLNICSKCEWIAEPGLIHLSIEWLPPCPRCESIMEGFRIINANV